MTTSLDGTRLEPDAPSLSTGSAGDASAIMLWSSAVSAKRLADAAERIAAALEQIAAFMAPEVKVAPGLAPDEGWIEWNGGAMPVSPGTLVDVRYRDGKRPFSGLAGDSDGAGRDASVAFWNHDHFDNDIVAYRLAATR